MKNAWILLCILFLSFTSCKQLIDEILDDIHPDDDDDTKEINFEEIGSIFLEPGVEEPEGAAEISAYDPKTMQLFVVNNYEESTIDVVDLSEPSSPTLVNSINIAPYGGGVNSVAVSKGLLAAAVEAENATHPGSVVFFDTKDLSEVNVVTVGALPDMVTFTPNGRFALVANEGEPNLAA